MDGHRSQRNLDTVVRIRRKPFHSTRLLFETLLCGHEGKKARVPTTYLLGVLFACWVLGFCQYHHTRRIPNEIFQKTKHPFNLARPGSFLPRKKSAPFLERME